MPPTYNGGDRNLATDGGGAWVLVWDSAETPGARSASTTARLQLNNLGNGRCWETLHSTNVRNDSEFFKARSD